jgi:hypothetical protein
MSVHLIKGSHVSLRRTATSVRIEIVARRTASGAPDRAAVIDTESMSKWRAIWGTIVLAVGLVTGFFPGSSTRATVDRCYVLIGDWTPDETRCIGHWSTAGFTVTGQVYGVSVGGDWQPTGRRPDGWYEVTAPDAAHERPAVAVPGAAVTYPVVVWLVRVVAFLVVAVSVIVLVSRAKDRWFLRAYERQLRDR